MSADDTKATENHSYVMVMNREKRLHDDSSNLVREGICVTIRDISSLLDESPGIKVVTTSKMGFRLSPTELLQRDRLERITGPHRRKFREWRL